MKKIEGGIAAVGGFLASGVRAEIKEEGLDLALIYSKSPACGAAVFTTNQVQAAPVKLSRKNVQEGNVQAVVINSGVANACTGKKGRKNAEKMLAKTAEELELEPEEVVVASTGVIGDQLPIDRITVGIEQAAFDLSKSGGNPAARAIMTTDTYPKELALEFEVAGTSVRLGGIAKGSGMIEPNMATMLSFFTTDVAIDRELLVEALDESVEYSFNKITVDGDQSTNDTVAILANGEAGNEKITEKGAAYEQFLGALEYATRELAQEIVRDGEGGNKFVEVEVVEAVSEKQAEKIARKVANSSLVKTALFGEDSNWGRIVGAVGAAGEDIDLAKLEVTINGEDVFGPKEEVHDFPEDLLKEDEIFIKIHLDQGIGAEKIWTCDLSYDYVEINAEYHT